MPHDQLSQDRTCGAFRLEAEGLAVAYLSAVGKVWMMFRILEAARRDSPEFDAALSERFDPLFDKMFRRIPKRYQQRPALNVALLELEMASDLGDDELLLSALRALYAPDEQGAAHNRSVRQKLDELAAELENDPVN